MNNMTAKEFLKDSNLEKVFKSGHPSIETIMIEFAKMHVKAIKKEIAEDYLYYLEGDEGSERLNTKKFFKEAYPESNIV